MITKKRQRELLEYARTVNATQRAPFVEQPIAESMRRLKAQKREAKRGPNNDEERDLFTCFRLQLWEEWERFAEHVLDQTMPDAKRGRANLQQNRQNAPLGGKATARYTDAEVTDAFTDYKRRNDGKDKTAWDAANALIRTGKALSAYKGWTGPWNRIGRIAKSQLGITRAEWFDAL